MAMQITQPIWHEGLTPQDTTYMLSSMVKAKDWLLKSHGDSKCIIVQTDGDIFDNDDTDSFGSIKSTCQDNEIVIQSIALDSDMGNDNYDFMCKYLCTRGDVFSAGRGQNYTLDKMLSHVFSKMSEQVAKNIKLCFEFAPMIGQQQSFKQYVKRIINTKDNSEITSKIRDNKVEIGSFASRQKANFLVEIQHKPQAEAAYESGLGKGVSKQGICKIYVEYQDVTGKNVKTSPQIAMKEVYSDKYLCDSNSTDITEADRLAILANAERIRRENLKALANLSGAARKAAETEALQANDIINKYGSAEQKEKSQAFSKAIRENNARAYNPLAGGSDSE